MKFTRSTYEGSPCWTVTGRWVYFDADWNTRFPFGTSLCLRIGPKHPWPKPDSKHRQARRGLTLDVNAPLGEPNRLYLWGSKRQYMIGLLASHEFRETGRRKVARGTAVNGDWVRCLPRPVRGQAWDWKRCEDTTPPRWRWIVVHPNDWQARWARAHPEEAAAVEERRESRLLPEGCVMVRKPGACRLPGRSRVVSLRVTDGMLEQVRAAAAADGQTVSDWLRDAAWRKVSLPAVTMTAPDLRIVGWSCQHMSMTSVPGVLGKVTAWCGCDMQPIYDRDMSAAA